MIIGVDAIYYSTDGQQHTTSRRASLETIAQEAPNAAEIDFRGVNNVTVNRDSKKIIQAGGYTPERGIFCDLY